MIRKKNCYKVILQKSQYFLWILIKTQHYSESLEKG